MRYKLRATYFPDVDKVYFKLIRSSLDRSEIGKKAYRTFLKNGGKRDSQGRFSKPIKIIIKNGYFNRSTEMWTLTTEPEIQVDWVKVGQELQTTYHSNRGSIDEPEMVKRLTKVFKKHNLLREGVEI